MHHKGQAVPAADATRGVESSAEERVRVLGTDSAVVRDLGPDPSGVSRQDMLQLQVREIPEDRVFSARIRGGGRIYCM